MKTIKSTFILLLIASLSFISCDDEPLEGDFTDELNIDNGGSSGSGAGVSAGNGFAMTAKIDGQLYEMNTPFGNNHAREPIFGNYPSGEYLLLQGRFGGIVGNPEINLVLKRTHLVVGSSYQVNQGTDETTTHIDLIDNSNSILENTVSGVISVVSVDTVNKIVSGTFEFVSNDSEGNEAFVVTEGTFNYQYDVEE